jgi:hypothetical protein
VTRSLSSTGCGGIAEGWNPLGVRSGPRSAASNLLILQCAPRGQMPDQIARTAVVTGTRTACNAGSRPPKSPMTSAQAIASSASEGVTASRMLYPNRLAAKPWNRARATALPRHLVQLLECVGDQVALVKRIDVQRRIGCDSTARFRERSSPPGERPPATRPGQPRWLSRRALPRIRRQRSSG